MKQFDFQNRCFGYFSDRTKQILNTNISLGVSSNVIKLEKGIVIPAIRNDSNIIEGGIFSSKGEFVASFNMGPRIDDIPEPSFWSHKYPNKEKLVERNEDVIFGGVLWDHFGHFLRDTITRLWYVLKENKFDKRIIFLTMPSDDPFKLKNMLTAIGLDESQYELITKPTQFKQIIVPQQSSVPAHGFRLEHNLVFDKIISNVQPGKYQKVYLSKAKYTRNMTQNESYFEDFFRKRGFEIIYPETLSFEEQVSIVNGASEIVGVFASHLYLMHFCKKNTKLTMLGRSSHCFEHFCFKSYLYPVHMKELDVYFVDVSFNFLPTDFNDGNFLLGPTKYWIDYLNKSNISYEPDEVSFDIHVKPHIFDFVILWAQHYKNADSYNTIKNNSIADVINTILVTLLDTPINTKSLPERDDVTHMKHCINQLQSNNSNPNMEKEFKSFTEHTQKNFQNARTAILDIKSDNKSLNNEIISLRERIQQLEKLLDK